MFCPPMLDFFLIRYIHNYIIQNILWVSFFFSFFKEEKIQTDTFVIFVLTFKRINYTKVVAQDFDGFLICWSPPPTYTFPAPTLCLILCVKWWVLFSVFPVE